MYAGWCCESSVKMWTVGTAIKKLKLRLDTAANVARNDAKCSGCRARFGHDGPFLFGRFSAADAMYAPVVSRLHTYGIEVGAVSAAYMQAVMALPAWQEWYAAALKEEWLLGGDAGDWPTVLGVAGGSG